MISSNDVYPKKHTRRAAIRLVKAESLVIGIPKVKLSCNESINAHVLESNCFETEDEIIIYFDHEIQYGSGVINVSLDVPSSCPISDIIYERQHVPYRKNGETITFQVDIGDLTGSTTTLNVRTLIAEKGITIRLEHNLISRRAGMYISGEYPQMQINAAHHYIFAAYEVLKMLHIPEYLSENNLGYV